MIPQRGKRNILITAALPYVNNVPHLGNLIGCVLSADVYARFCRLRGHTVLYVSGTDEYGTATEVKAMQEGVTPKELCDRYFTIHERIYNWFNIAFDHFGRTTNPQQLPIAQAIFKRLDDNKLISEQDTAQLYCKHCNMYLADRFVQGTCPGCGSFGARGDQCEVCEKLYAPSDLLYPRCKICCKAPETRQCRHLFLDLHQLQPALRNWAATNSGWTLNARRITDTWLDGKEMQLRPRCISRDLKWGTPIPKQGYEHKVFYVWFDAPIGYISITADYLPRDWQKWWQPREEATKVELAQFMGKDNVAFHTVIFPATLIGTGQRWNLVQRLSTCEYLQYEGGVKFSKTHRTGVFGDDAMESGIASDVWRYYLLRNRPETSDTIFSWETLLNNANGELLGNLGNFCYRALRLLGANQTVGQQTMLNETDRDFLRSLNHQLQAYVKSLEAIHIRDGLMHVMQTSALANAYIQQNHPWKTDDEQRVETVLSICIHVVRFLALLAEPFIPDFSGNIYRQLLISPPRRYGTFIDYRCLIGHTIGIPDYNFERLDRTEIQQLATRFGE